MAVYSLMPLAEPVLEGEKDDSEAPLEAQAVPSTRSRTDARALRMATAPTEGSADVDADKLVVGCPRSNVPGSSNAVLAIRNDAAHRRAEPAALPPRSRDGLAVVEQDPVIIHR